MKKTLRIRCNRNIFFQALNNQNMVDYFEVLALPGRAALGENEIHSAYATKSRTAHPDHGGSEASAAEVNAAYEALRTPEKRLKHLLELAAPEDAKAWRTVPLDDAMMSLFTTLGNALQAAENFLQRKSSAQSALAKALLMNEEMQHRERLEGIGFEIEKCRREMESQLPAFDSALQCDDSSKWQQLAAMQARFSYLAKWQTQIRERLLALM
jgi:curved DNA-binding protein CbpA